LYGSHGSQDEGMTTRLYSVAEFHAYPYTRPEQRELVFTWSE